MASRQNHIEKCRNKISILQITDESRYKELMILLPEKHRINLVLSMDNPMQKKAWDILSEYPPGSRTSAICQALCEYRQQEAFLRAIRQLLEDKLSHIEISAVEKRPAATKNQQDDSAALAFIRSLQAE